MGNGFSSARGHRGLDLSDASPLENLTSAVEKQIDPFGVMTSIMNAQAAWMTHPQELTRAMTALSGDILALQTHVMRRAMGFPSEDVVTPHEDDTRFADPVWKDSASWDIIKETYLAFTHRFEDMCFETPGLSDKERRRAAFWFRKWLNAMAPTNFFWSNPVAMRKFVDTKGESVKQGFKYLMRDAQSKNVRMVEEDAFTVGTDLATTPGNVVFRNRMLELIHYAPTTEKVHKTPLVIITPWINKYYILDLTPKKSMVKWLTDQGFSVFITSWKNPTAEMSHVGFDDYLRDGVDAVVNFVCQLHKVPQVALAAYCIGGTLVSTYMAWANRHYGAGKVPVSCWTLFTTLTDFSKPGDIEVFIDEGSIRSLEQSMARKGYLDGSEMASSFRLLRSNSLIWHYFVNSYLYGEPLPAFDVLFWNMDTTRMPQAMHAYYLREMYLNNNLMKRDALTIAGEPIDLDRVKQPLYAVTAEDDHIAPWRQCYRIRKYINVDAPVRFVLSTSGHILGIVNPPVNPPKRSFWVGEPERNEHFELWFDHAEKKPGSWWEDWVAWLRPQCGPMVAPLSPAAKSYPSLGPSPGTYVFEK
ncbi:MAG: poly[(R)-3-hydroxyalkanoate] polymerase subunit PhaC [Pseudomonadota bacterium]|jgi:polyhydroxyalkanoate synthase|nr:poly[(R)-3-hydroxyalkanoate] polymerase subunit PhaC [Pseudomonadota bacterium]MDQ5881744.1 poly[(R)-3-hydroxyalkanoate] polymerase subunit PhaC [Pseudomonadota bacterium]MDQ5942899.1 poly[(R)-3-hydroxyalkanoate] polymerase subunit PhaC [Pseudomonadota bacterium]MDQ5960317.1 poly[(R)-3-hydroxyalkanoate] polymerase subunit PhaC [Pseudomonadota bacterium]